MGSNFEEQKRQGRALTAAVIRKIVALMLVLVLAFQPSVLADEMHISKYSGDFFQREEVQLLGSVAVGSATGYGFGQMLGGGVGVVGTTLGATGAALFVPLTIIGGLVGGTIYAIHQIDRDRKQASRAYELEHSTQDFRS